MTKLIFVVGICADIATIAPLNAFASTLVHVSAGRMLTGLTDPQLRHACIQEGLILGMGRLKLDGNNSAAAINKYGNITDHCLTTPTPEYTFKVKYGTNGPKAGVQVWQKKTNQLSPPHQQQNGHTGMMLYEEGKI